MEKIEMLSKKLSTEDKEIIERLLKLSLDMNYWVLGVVSEGKMSLKEAIEKAEELEKESLKKQEFKA